MFLSFCIGMLYSFLNYHFFICYHCSVCMLRCVQFYPWFSCKPDCTWHFFWWAILPEPCSVRSLVRHIRWDLTKHFPELPVLYSQALIQASKLWNLSPNCYNICVLRVLTTLGKCSEAFCGEKNHLKYAKESKRREQTPRCKELWNGLWMTVFGLLITKHRPSNVN